MVKSKGFTLIHALRVAIQAANPGHGLKPDAACVSWEHPDAIFAITIEVLPYDADPNPYRLNFAWEHDKGPQKAGTACFSPGNVVDCLMVMTPEELPEFERDEAALAAEGSDWTLEVK